MSNIQQSTPAHDTYQPYEHSPNSSTGMILAGCWHRAAWTFLQEETREHSARVRTRTTGSREVSGLRSTSAGVRKWCVLLDEKFEVVDDLCIVSLVFNRSQYPHTAARVVLISAI
jgi:hypothetical protein